MYTAARWIFVGDFNAAQTHANWIVDLEKSAGVAVEGAVQEALDAGVISTMLSNIYLAAQLLVLPASLVWLYHRSEPIYRRLRTTIVATWLIAVPIMALFPVAPPRLMGLGMADTVSQQAAVALTGHSTVFYNPYAAVPSLHVGFAFAIGIAVATAVNAPWAKLLAYLWGPIVSLTVVATANHYVFEHRRWTHRHRSRLLRRPHGEQALDARGGHEGQGASRRPSYAPRDHDLAGSGALSSA